ncbi:hypothetical protein KFK09_015889 [Dendrobium nobile]|uniref:Uncharacterized protein n=1 Tax=Dendrobium nobile TaxID=94219 RepID=A0A8T3B7A8_DENNO|nr:hypothetical protein KFK09_015889 [Dendrobium nobile]
MKTLSHQNPKDEVFIAWGLGFKRWSKLGNVRSSHLGEELTFDIETKEREDLRTKKEFPMDPTQNRH